MVHCSRSLTCQELIVLQRLEIQTWMSVPAMFPSICQTPLPSAAGSGRPHYQVLFAAENALVKYPSHILYEIDAQGNRSAGQVIVPLNGPQGLGLIRYGLPVGHPRFPLPPAVRDLDVKQTDAGKKQEHAKALNDHREAVNRYWEYARLPLYKTKQAIESSGQPEPFDAAYSIYHPDYMRSQLGYGTIKKCVLPEYPSSKTLTKFSDETISRVVLLASCKRSRQHRILLMLAALNNSLCRSRISIVYHMICL